ncbi:hypothetical protein ACJMK2_036705 [Sinanodonta woodiana]|uniref:SOCS box domain-containing protein n=1 Tax=Sinanodonta woodiana TaxID=1069815 RepID=A0ABD3WI23_SINWO
MDFREAYPDTCSTVGMAAMIGDLQTMMKLVQAGKPVDVKDNRGWTPLHEASFNGHANCIKFLLQQEKVEVDFKTFEDETALVLAARKGHIDCVEILLHHQADPNTGDPVSCMFTPLCEATKANSLGCVHRLVEAGADVHVQDFSGYMPLHLAAEEGCKEILEYLLHHGAELKRYTENNLSPLFLAAQYGHLDCLELLLLEAKKLGELDVVNVTAVDNASPLLIAAQGGHHRCVKMLLQYGADANIVVDDKKAAPLHYAVIKNFPRCLKLLLPVTDLETALSTEIQYHPLITAVEHEDTTCLKLLIDAGYDFHCRFDYRVLGHRFLPLSAPNSFGFEPVISLLCHAISAEATELLLESGLSPNPIQQYPLEYPPLIKAIFSNEDRIFKLLLKYGANVNIYSRLVCGNLPLYCAVTYFPARKFIPYLLLAGAEPESLFRCQFLGDHFQHEQQGKKCLQIELKNCGLYVTLGLLLCFCSNLSIADNGAKCLKDKESQREPDITLLTLQESTNTLSHACRRQIILQMAANTRYTPASIATLQIPSILKDYLLFKEYGEIGLNVIDAFSNLC